jgi:hypothetical protein
MSLFSQWQDIAQAERTPEEANAFWKEYFAAETKNYEKILENKDTVYAGSLLELAQNFDMEPVVFAGFLDGINTSLKKEINLEKLKEDSDVKLDIDFEKLYFNMMEAKASWLYGLPQWEDVLPEDKRREITKAWRSSKMAVSEKVDRNAPCPCGSGLKYKKCCGKNA